MDARLQTAVSSGAEYSMISVHKFEDLIVPSISRQVSRDQKTRPIVEKVPEEKLSANIAETKTLEPAEKSNLPSSKPEQAPVERKISDLNRSAQTPIQNKPDVIKQKLPEKKIEKPEQVLKPVAPLEKEKQVVNQSEKTIDEAAAAKTKVESTKVLDTVQTDQDSTESRKPNLGEIDQQISTDQEIQKLNESVDKPDFARSKTKSTSDVLKKKKIYQAGEFGGSVPSIEKILGSSEIRAINDDFIKRERQFINKVLSASAAVLPNDITHSFLAFSAFTTRRLTQPYVGRYVRVTSMYQHA